MNARRWLECLVLYGALPLVIVLTHERALMIAIMWGGALFAYGTLRWRQGFTFRREWNASALTGAALGRMVLRFALLAPLLAGFTWVYEPARFLSFPVQRPVVWGMVMLLYPILSAFPQELIFRSLFFERYAGLVPERWRKIASAALFSYAHLVFANWIALSFTLAGGWLFADTYTRSRSLALVTLEHALYGCLLFTLGLGWYFYGTAWVR